MDATAVPAVYRAITEVAKELAVIGIAKNRKNQQQGYSFRGIDDLFNALAPLISKTGLCILPRVIKREVTERATKSGGVLFYTVVDMEFDFVAAEDGSRHVVRTIGEAMDSGDKSTNKAMSAAYKYACFQAFCIPVEGETPDADSVTHDVAPRPEPVKRERRPKPAPPSYGPFGTKLREKIVSYCDGPLTVQGGNDIVKSWLLQMGVKEGFATAAEVLKDEMYSQSIYEHVLEHEAREHEMSPV